MRTRMNSHFLFGMSSFPFFLRVTYEAADLVAVTENAINQSHHHGESKGELNMKSSIVSSAFLVSILFGCGAAKDSANQMSDMKSAAPLSCTIQTNNGRYLTAVGGGGRISDVLHTDATKASTWERFVLINTTEGVYHLKTANGHYLTAVSGGGRITDVMHSDATQAKAWETFTLSSLGNNYYSIQTNNGRYLTATGGGGQINDAIHSDAITVQAWERFRFTCQYL